MNRGAVASFAVLVAAVAAYAFIDDLFNGLPFTRASSSWMAWAIGLIVLGGVGLLVEGAIEWSFERRDPWRPGPARVVRIAVVALLVAIVLGAYRLLSK